MNKKELKAIRERMGLKQTEFAARLRMNQGSISRMESGEMIITPPMELLIELVAKEHGVDPSHGGRSRGATQGQTAQRGNARNPVRQDRKRKRS
jgi:transcriptional regulator with XRE-family HTH domain